MAKRGNGSKPFYHGRGAYYKGIQCYHKGDTLMARHYFLDAMQDYSLHNDVLFWLVEIDLKESKYASARELLESKCDIFDDRYHYLYGILESIEMNYQASLDHYNHFSSCKCTQTKYSSMLGLCDTYIQLGEHDKAREICFMVRENKEFFILATVKLVFLDVLEGKYEEAYELFQSLNYIPTNVKLKNRYSNTLAFLSFLRGALLDDMDISFYFQRRLFDRSDEMLLRHIEEHRWPGRSASEGCFLKEIDFSYLLNQVQSQISDRNGNHYQMTDYYCLRMDRTIGLKGSVETNDVRVVTLLGSKDIITIYPILLSDYFDQEGMATSKSLVLKRKQGGQIL